MSKMIPILAHLYEYKGREDALLPALALVFALTAALVAVPTLTKCLSFMLKYFCDGQSTVSKAILHMDRPCFFS